MSQVLMYGLIKVLVPEARFYCVDVITSGVGHAINLYEISEGVFVPLETTMSDRTYKDRINRTRINASYQTKYRLVFDDKHEYLFK